MTPTLLLTPLLGLALAEDPPAPPTELPEAPKIEMPELPEITARTRGERPVPWRVVLFEDPADSADCDPVEALRGRCIEDVRFLPAPSAEDTPTQREQWRSLAVQEALLWESLAYRWGVEEDPIATSIVAAGFDTLPSPADSWERAPSRRSTVSAPDPAALLAEPAWSGSADAFFPAIRYRVTNGLQKPATVVISGRFAERLGAQGRPHDYDLMDGEPADSSPFFEQLYPFANAEQARMPRPLSEFDLPAFTLPFDAAELPPETRARLERVTLATYDFPTFQRTANDRFAEFVRQLSVQVSQFALEDYTPNHLRVFTSLSAMVWPPRETTTNAAARRLVAAARGETDAAADIAARVDRSTYVLRAGFRLDLEAISPAVAADWVEVLYDPSAGPGDVRALQAAFSERQGANVRRDAPPLTDPRFDTMRQWAREARGSGVDDTALLDDGQRFALGWYLDRLRTSSPDGKGRFERYATEILLDQLRRSAAGVLDDTPGAKATPADVVAKVSKQWETQLNRHGFAPAPMPQAYGGVDPTAICTTVDGPDALNEPSFGAVNLDVLVRATYHEPLGVEGAGPGELSPEDTKRVLWEARERMPFVLVDDPDEIPTGTLLARLPDGKALYRLRWPVWTGWHLFWTPERLPEGRHRLAVRTGAVCDDTVLAAQDLVPTLARAALLIDTYRPTAAVPLSVGRKDATGIGAPPTELVDYLRERIRRPLHRLAESLGGVLLVAAEVDGGAPPFDVVPPTPYARDGFAGGGAQGRTAMWARFFGSEDPSEPVLVYPAYRPTDSVESESLRPRWTRLPTTSATFTAGLGMFPLRRVDLACGPLAGDEGTVGPCVPGSTWSEGGSVDLAAMSTFWVLDRPRLGLETGIEARLDVGHPGRSWTHPESEPAFTWMLRPGGGLLVGLRAAPRPGPLAAPGGGRGLWGADRADGSSRLGRIEGGIRAGYLLAPGYNGAEGTAVAEIWAGVSARRSRSPAANLTPYDPGSLYGLFARFMYADTLIPDGVDRRYELEGSYALVAGLRGTWDVQLELPEAPKVKQ